MSLYIIANGLCEWLTNNIYLQCYHNRLINMRIKYVFLLAFITLSVVSSGCTINTAINNNTTSSSQPIGADIYGHKVPPQVDNNTLMQINIEWNKLQKDNVSIINSSATVTHLYAHENTNITDETIRFNTTDGNTHTSNLSIDRSANSQRILDIDGYKPLNNKESYIPFYDRTPSKIVLIDNNMSYAVSEKTRNNIFGRVFINESDP